MKANPAGRDGETQTEIFRIFGMRPRERLEELLKASELNRGKFAVVDGEQLGLGNIPVHYKRNTVKDVSKYTRIGMTKMLAYFNAQVYFTQALIAGLVLSREYTKIGIITPSQMGKLIADDELVLTRNGWKTHGELVVGDEVISPSGEFAKVTYVHPKGVADRLVTFRNGVKIKCNHRHEWYLWHRDKHRFETVETDDINPKAHKAEPIAPIVGEEKELPIHPYVLGVWLGDGATTKGQIHSSKQDIAVLDRVREFYPKGSEWVHKDTGVITRSFIGLAGDLSAYGMCYEEHPERTKYIPDDYLTASLEQRLQLLAGLIDTDGYRYESDGRFYYSTTSEAIKDGLEALLATFGWNSSTVMSPARVSSSGVHGRKAVYQIGFNPSFEIPCVLERKRASRLSRLRRIGVVSVEEIEPVVGNCITVEGGLYCVGRKLMPTHNSWLMGHIAIALAYDGMKVNVAAATEDMTDIIMREARRSVVEARYNIKNALSAEQIRKIDRLDQSVSKTRLSFAGRGSIQGITLGAAFEGIRHNKAVGQSGGYIVDEAALISPDALAEVGRREFSTVDSTKYPLIMISNPHNPGYFYDFMTKEEMKPGECVIWADALTMCQETRFTREQVLDSDFAEHTDTLERYLLCELPSQGQSMFGKAIVDDVVPDGIRVMGVDAAWKGKDNIEVCTAILSEKKVYIESVETIVKKDWIDGETSREIIAQIARIYHALNCEMCCVDTGQGVWLLEGLKYNGVNVRGVEFGAGTTKSRKREKVYSALYGANKRAEMHLDLQSMMDDETVVFSSQVHERIREVLPVIHAEKKANGTFLVCPKAEIKAKIGHSPDAFDAVLLALHAVALYAEGDVAYMEW